MLCSYLTQLRLHQDEQAIANKSSIRHEVMLWLSFVIFFLSLGAFGLGSLSAVNRFATNVAQATD